MHSGNDSRRNGNISIHFVVLFLFLYIFFLLYSSHWGFMVNPPMVHLIQTLPPWLQRYWFFCVYTWHTGNARKQAKNPPVLRNLAYGWHTDSANIRMLDTLPFSNRYARKNEQMRSKREEMRSALPSAVNPAGRLTHCLSPAWKSTLENTREIHCILPIIASILRCNALKSYFVPHPPRTPAGIACVCFEWLGGARFLARKSESRHAPDLGRVAR